MSPPLLLADAPGLLYRAFFALPDTITGTDGAPVNALLGSVNALLQAAREHRPRAVVACFGQESAAYRKRAFPPYHSHRPPMPDALAAQWQQAPGLYRALGLQTRSHRTLEADDLMHSLAADESEAGGSALILTGDRDMFQCAGEHVRLLLTQGGRSSGDGPELVDAAGVQARYGLGPALVPDFIALRGDPSDGIPGGKGIGAKTAQDLLARHGSLDAALDRAVRERPAVRHALIEQREQLLMFRDLATLRRVRVDAVPDAPIDAAGGARAARRLGMRGLAERLEGS